MGPHDDDGDGGGQTLGQRHALEALRWNWGEAYKITVTVSRWKAWRLDRIGGVIEAASPEELRTAILDDYMMKPVPRDVGGPS